MKRLHPKLETLIDQTLFPNEPVFWRGQPGGGFLTRKGWIFFVILNGPFAGIALYAAFRAFMSGTVSEAISPLAAVIGLMILLTGFLKFVDYLVRRRTAYVITDQRILYGARDRDSGWFVEDLHITKNTNIWYTKRWNTVHIRTPYSDSHWLGRFANFIRLGGISMNDVENPEDVVAMVEAIKAQSQKGQKSE